MSRARHLAAIAWRGIPHAYTGAVYIYAYTCMHKCMLRQGIGGRVMRKSGGGVLILGIRAGAASLIRPSAPLRRA